MNGVKVQVTISRSASDAFDFTINPGNTPKWVDGIIQEKVNETPTRLGTIYRNQGHDGEWAEFEITDFKPGTMFEMTKKGDNVHVQYTFTPCGQDECELEYYAWVKDGKVPERFSEENIRAILHKLKSVIEA